MRASIRLLRYVTPSASKGQSRLLSTRSYDQSSNSQSYDQTESQVSSEATESDGFKYDFEEQSSGNRQSSNRSYDRRSSDRPSYQSNDRPNYRSNDRPSYQSNDRPSYQSNDRSSYQSNDRPSYRSSDRPSYRSSDRPSYQSSDRPSYQSSDRPNYQSNNRSSYQSNNRSSYQSNNRSNYQSDNRSNYQSNNQPMKYYEPKPAPSFPQARGEFVYGFHPCIAALSAHKRVIYRVYIQRGIEDDDVKKIEAFRKAFIQPDIESVDEAPDVPEIQWIDRHSLNLMCDQRPHNGVIIDCSPLPVEQVDRLTESRGVSVLLDCLTDPANIGSIIRSSTFMGATCVYLSKRNCAPLSPVLSKASAGAAELMTLAHVKSTTKFIREARLANPSLHVVGLTGDPRAISCRSLSSESQDGRPVLLVCGSEGEGLRQVVKQECETLAFIDSAPSCPSMIDSLNVSQALAIALYQCTK